MQRELFHPTKLRIPSRRRQAAAMEGSTIDEGGRSSTAGCLTRTMGRRATVSPVERYELDGYNKAGGTALLLCSLKLRFFTDVNVQSPHLQLTYRWTKHRQCPTHAMLCSRSIFNVMEKIVMHVTDSRSGHKNVKVINLANNHPSSGTSS